MRLLSSDTIRRCYIADPGHLILSADFDQIELRVAAGLAGETPLIEAAKRGESLHKIGAVRLFGEKYTPDQYRYTKNVNFGWLYGGGAKTLSEQAGIPFADAVSIIREYEQVFPSLRDYKRRRQRDILKAGLTPQELKTYYGLRNRMYGLRTDTSEGKKARFALKVEMDRLLWNKTARVLTPYGRSLIVDVAKAYTVVNYEISSTAADIMKEALLRVMDDPELEPTVLLPIHDEILGQAPKSKAEYIAKRYGEVMSCSFRGVPIDATGKVYGKSWGHGYRKENS